MNQLTPERARLLRLQAGLRLIDIAHASDCAPATVRSYEFGAPVRASTLVRLEFAYERLCIPESDAATNTSPRK